MGKLISVTKASAILGISPRRVQIFIAEGRLPAQRFGRSFAIDQDDLALIARKPVGRPKK